jgi:hypothetical protein
VLRPLFNFSNTASDRKNDVITVPRHDNQESVYVLAVDIV